MSKDNDFKCHKCKKQTDRLFIFGPITPPEKEIGLEYCEKCWELHPLNKNWSELIPLKNT